MAFLVKQYLIANYSNIIIMLYRYLNTAMLHNFLWSIIFLKNICIEAWLTCGEMHRPRVSGLFFLTTQALQVTFRSACLVSYGYQCLLEESWSELREAAVRGGFCWIFLTFLQLTILFLLRSQYRCHQAGMSSWGLSAISGDPRVAQKTEVLKLPIHSGALIGLFANVNCL